MLADYHIHTKYSDDSSETMENVARRATLLHMDEICFTDHVDYGVKYDWDERPPAGAVLNVDYPAYFEEITALQQQYSGQLAIKKGLEFGVQTHTIARYEALFAAWPLDFVILSCHQVEDREFWNGDFQKGWTPDEYNQRYYEEIYHCVCQYKNYSVLGHLDMIQRYNDVRYPFEKSREIIAAILEQAIADGKGIEINTSSFQYNLPDLTPERNILKLYRDLGGTILTVGSDCHSACRLGEHIPALYDELAGMGFGHVCTFDGMEPVFHPLQA